MQYSLSYRLGGFAPGLDPDAAAYIAAVEAADTQALEAGVKKVYNDFIVGCKVDGIWDAIKASCILAGARTLTGALTPLKGGAPTNVSNNFVSGDYNRETGLLGDGVGKWLNTNRANNVDPQNSSHNAVYQTSAPTTTATRVYIGSDSVATNGANSLYSASLSGIIFCGNRITSTDQVSGGASTSNGLFGHTRSSSTNVTLRVGDTNYPETTNNSATPTASNIGVFSRPSGTIFFDGRLSFYSTGEHLDLSLLEARLDTLMTDLATAI